MLVNEEEGRLDRLTDEPFAQVTAAEVDPGLPADVTRTQVNGPTANRQRIVDERDALGHETSPGRLDRKRVDRAEQERVHLRVDLCIARKRHPPSNMLKAPRMLIKLFRRPPLGEDGVQQLQLHP
jgi:hypothetical protein